MSWEEVNQALDVTLTAVIACRKAALRAKALADRAEAEAEEANYWATKLKWKLLLFQEGGID